MGLIKVSPSTQLPCETWDCDCVFKYQKSCCCVANNMYQLSVDTFEILTTIWEGLNNLKRDIDVLTGQHTAFAASMGPLTSPLRCFGPFTRNMPISYSNVTLNNDRAYNPSLGTFTAYDDGYYIFTFTAYSNLITTGLRQYFQLQLMKNGEPVVAVWENNREDTEDSSTQVVLLPLERGDQVYVELLAGRYICGDLKRNMFSGYLLYPN
ncbi:Caprin-2-like [Arapaima gigas]